MNFGLHLSEAVLIPNPIWLLPTWAPFQTHSYGTQFSCPHPTHPYVNKFPFWTVAKGTSHLLRVHTQSICTKDDQLTDTDISRCVLTAEYLSAGIFSQILEKLPNQDSSSSSFVRTFTGTWSRIEVCTALQHAALQTCVLTAKQMMTEQLLWA
jgi:hypothetical protein